MRHIAFALFTSALIAGFVSISAVTASAQPCPKLIVEPGEGATSEGTREILTAYVTGAPAGVKPTQIKWTTTAGKGEMGKTVGVAYLDTTGVPVGTVITVEAAAEGFAGCTVKAKTTIKMVKAAVTACPTISVYSPDSVKKGAPMTMSVNVSGGDARVTPTYNWTISAGTISSGQGTPTITINTAGADMVTGTVDVGGYDRKCSTSNSSTTIVESTAPTRKFDEFGAMVKTEDQWARLDNFAIELQNDPTAKGVLIFYAGRKSRKGAIEALTDETKKYLSATRGIRADRIVLQNGGFRENGAIEMWIMPQGSEAPTASPTVDPSEAQQLPALKPKPVKKPKKI